MTFAQNLLCSSIITVVCTVSLVLSWTATYHAWLYDLKDNGDGTITSRKYGTYPKEVEFHQGMSLMLGQTAKMDLSSLIDADGSGGDGNDD